MAACSVIIPHPLGVAMTKECWCFAYHHPEYERNPDNESWYCECCARDHQLPNTKYIDEALTANEEVMREPYRPFVGTYPPNLIDRYVPRSRPAIAVEHLAPVMYAAGFFGTNRRTYAIAGPPLISGAGLIISHTPLIDPGILPVILSGINPTI